MNPDLPSPSFPERAHNKTVQVLYEISNAANRSVDLNELYQSIHKALGRILKADNFFIALYHEDNDTISFPYYVDEVDKNFSIIKNVSEKKSLTARVVRTGVPLLADEKQLLELYAQDPEKAVGTCSKIWAGTPMKIRGKAFGAIVLQDYQDPAAYQESDLDILSTVSGFIALFIDRKREENARNESEKLNRVLFSISNAVNTTDNLDELYRSIYSALNRIIPLPNFFIAIVNREKKRLSFPFFVDEHDKMQPLAKGLEKYEESTSNTSRVIRTKKPLFMTEAMLRKKQNKQQIIGTISKVWLGVPLMIKEEVIGVMVVQHYEDPNYFTAKDIELLTAVTDQVAIAIDRKREEEARQKSERINRVMFSISNAVNITNNLNALFNSIYDTLTRLIALPNFFICIYQKQTNSMYFPFYIDEYDSEETISFTIEDIGIESSITTDVIRSKKPLFLTKEMLIQRKKEKRIVGKVPVIWLGIPLIIRDEVIGVMAVQHYSDPHYFTQEDMDLFVAISDQVALAIDRKQSQEIILEREKQIIELSRQTEELSLVAASIISMKDEKRIFNHISNAIVENSDYEKLIISYFTDQPPYREILGYKGVEQSIVNEIKGFNISKEHFEKILDKGTKVGHFACFLPRENNDILSPKLLALFTGGVKSFARRNEWHPNDMLFIPMTDANGNLMGVISVGKSKSGHLPTNETVRPLEIFSSLISQIIIVRKIQNELKDHKENLEKRVADRTKALTQEIKERIQIEKKLKKAKIDAEAAAQAKLEFLANMSHEIRTPINGVMGMAEIALEKDLDEDLKQIFLTIDSEADQLLKIINEILDFSKIEAGKLEIEKIDFDVCRVFEKTCASLAMTIPDDAVEFISFFSPEIPRRLVGDPGRLRQILVNLTSNAVKFTEKGEIFVIGELLKDHGRYVELKFTIKDTGIGIAKEKQQTVFESFKQADGSTTRKYGGTGLGTTISKQIVELMGGRIGLKSEPGKGSVFWFTAIFEKQPERSPQTSDGTAIHLEGLHLLVVTHNASNRFVFEKYLTAFGCRPVLVDSSKKAVQHLEKQAQAENRFDLVITDLSLPRMNGFELAGKIRSMPSNRRMPIIVLSSAGKAGEGNTCRDIGINGYLPKPVKKQELKMIIASVLGKADAPKKAARELVTRHSMAEEMAGKVSILVVEDYPTNQKIATKHLENVGYRVTLAENGLQACQLYKKKHFDLILMDIQMPEMDGYEATQKIREYENKINQYDIKTGPKSSFKQFRIPIIAMTAHAIKGYREKCIAAGMDDYITKPLKRQAFLEIVARWIPGNIALQELQSISSSRDKPVQVKESISGELSMDFDKALDEFENDRDFLFEVLDEFCENMVVQLTTIGNAIKKNDAETVRAKAHAIKGGAANLTAVRLSTAAHELELIGKSGSLDNSGTVFNTLKDEFESLRKQILDLTAAYDKKTSNNSFF